MATDPLLVNVQDALRQGPYIRRSVGATCVAEVQVDQRGKAEPAWLLAHNSERNDAGLRGERQPP